MIVVQALLDIARQTARIGLHLINALHMRALQRHAARHDQADIAAAQNDDFMADHDVLQIDIILRNACGINACGALPGNGKRAARAFTAAHCQKHRIGLKLQQPAFPAGGGNDLIPADIQYGAVRDGFNPRLDHLIDKALGVFRPGQGLAKTCQAEAVVDALTQDSAQKMLAFKDQNILHALFPKAQCGCKTRRASANDDDLLVRHSCSPPLT